MRIVLLAALLAASPAIADETSGVILAFDRVANRIVLTDKTVWEVTADVTLPENLAAGDKVTFVYESAGEDGFAKFDSVTRN